MKPQSLCAGRPRAAARLPRRRRQDDPARAARRCSPRLRKMPGLDGAKMSKSYGNTIPARGRRRAVSKKIRTMPTDPARVRRTDPGDPEKCPVWQLHQVYSERRDPAMGADRAARTRRHRLPRMQAAGDRRGAGRTEADARARQAISGGPARWCATSSPTAAKRRASWRARRCATCARRWG